jgi:hypothetical protein
MVLAISCESYISDCLQKEILAKIRLQFAVSSLYIKVRNAASIFIVISNRKHVFFYSYPSYQDFYTSGVPSNHFQNYCTCGDPLKSFSKIVVCGDLSNRYSSIFVTSAQRCVFASFLSGGFTTMAVINPLERKLAKRTSVQCTLMRFSDLKETSIDITADSTFEKFR